MLYETYDDAAKPGDGRCVRMSPATLSFLRDAPASAIDDAQLLTFLPQIWWKAKQHPVPPPPDVVLDSSLTTNAERVSTVAKQWQQTSMRLGAPQVRVVIIDARAETTSDGGEPQVTLDPNQAQLEEAVKDGAALNIVEGECNRDVRPSPCHIAHAYDILSLFTLNTVSLL